MLCRGSWYLGVEELGVLPEREVARVFSSNGWLEAVKRSSSEGWRVVCEYRTAGMEVLVYEGDLRGEGRERTDTARRDSLDELSELDMEESSVEKSLCPLDVFGLVLLLL